MIINKYVYIKGKKRMKTHQKFSTQITRVMQMRKKFFKDTVEKIYEPLKKWTCQPWRRLSRRHRHVQEEYPINTPAFEYKVSHLSIFLFPETRNVKFSVLQATKNDKKMVCDKRKTSLVLWVFMRRIDRTYAYSTELQNSRVTSPLSFRRQWAEADVLRKHSNFLLLCKKGSGN